MVENEEIDIKRYTQKNKVGMAVLTSGKVELTIKNTEQDKEDQ